MKITKQGTYRHYRRSAAGELVLVGDVAYTYKAEENHEHFSLDARLRECAEREQEKLDRLEAERETFEDWVDNACELEG